MVAVIKGYIMEQFRLRILVESRIRWKVYVRFGGEYLETYHSNMIRRWVLSLHNQVVKALKTNFSEKRAFALLKNLEMQTVQLIHYQQKILIEIESLQNAWLQK